MVIPETAGAAGRSSMSFLLEGGAADAGVIVARPAKPGNAAGKL